jgi:riboflavin synthase
MFTGLVEALGRVEFIKPSRGGIKLGVKTDLGDINTGDSVAVNGACLTAVGIEKNLITFDVSQETLNRTNLRFLKSGDYVNLERALTLNKPLGGHIVQGHVDTLGRVEKLTPSGEHHLLVVSFPEKYTVYTVEKGSIAVDGISLTINKVGANFVEINVIPHTFRETNLKFRKRGDFVNLEFDLFGKYVVNYLKRVEKRNKIFGDFLKGF